MAEELTGLTLLVEPSVEQVLLSYVCSVMPPPRHMGFVIYGEQDGISQIIFTKTKEATVKYKLLPTLELLAVFIVFKALHFVVRGYFLAVITNIYIFVDAQLLKDNIRIKNIFARNIAKEINGTKNQIMKNSDIRIKYKYVYIADNPADLISRGITIAKFENMYAFWSNGPHWVSKDEKEWPTCRFECLSTALKILFPQKIYNISKESNVEPVISFSKFSSWKKLNKVTSLVYKFLYKYKRKDQTDHLQPAKLYLINTMQKENFCRELSFLKDSTE